jgi:hypothetical protein
MKNCKACGGSYRKGTRALVFGEGGSEPGLVCPACAGKGLLVVAKVKAPTIVKKVVRDDTVEAALRSLKTYTAAAKAMRPMTVAEDAFMSGKIEGYESAIETLKACAEGR